MIDIQREDAIWYLRINRPDKANSLTSDMLHELLDGVEQAKRDARVLILSGQGKVFSAGADLDAARAGLATDPVWEKLSAAIVDFPGLSVAALNGTLAGGAFGMVLACDLRIAVPEAKFFYPVMKLGVLPQPSDPSRMSRLIGPARTKMILMAGEKIDAATALNWGLIDQIAPSEDLMEAARRLAEPVLAAHPPHAKEIKALIR